MAISGNISFHHSFQGINYYLNADRCCVRCLLKDLTTETKKIIAHLSIVAILIGRSCFTVAKFSQRSNFLDSTFFFFVGATLQGQRFQPRGKFQGQSVLRAIQPDLKLLEERTVIHHQDGHLTLYGAKCQITVLAFAITSHQ